MGWRWGSCLVLICLALQGCNQTQPYRYHSEREIPAGPGIFSDVEFVQSPAHSRQR